MSKKVVFTAYLPEPGPGLNLSLITHTLPKIVQSETTYIILEMIVNLLRL